MSKKKLAILSGIGSFFAPLFALAVTQACTVTNDTIEGIFCKARSILNTIVPLLVTLGVVYFVWGVVQYIMTGDEAKKKEGRTKMIYGIIGLVVIITMWGLVFMVKNTFGIENVGNVQLPTLNIAF